jgi:hypothetical protein
MTTEGLYKIPDEFFFRLHHVRSRFKNDVEEVLLYVATSISNNNPSPKKDFDQNLNSILFEFKKNKTLTKKTIDNWRTEISTFFGLIQSDGGVLMPSNMSKRLAQNQYLDEFFNYFLFTFQYPGGFLRPDYLANQLSERISFKPCPFILLVLKEGEKILGRSMSITSEELTYCAFFDLRVTRDGRTPKEVAELILYNRERGIDYVHEYSQLKTTAGSFISKGDVERQAGDILDYMVYANLLNHKGVGRYYYLNKKNTLAIDYHLNHHVWFDKYDGYMGKSNIPLPELSRIREDWFSFVNAPSNIDAFAPRLDNLDSEELQSLFQEYYHRVGSGLKVTTKDIGDFGESAVLIHEILRTKPHSNRQHLINKIPTPLGVGYDIQSIEIEKLKRYIEVKTTRSKKAITQNRVHLTHNEWDTAQTLGNRYFIYYLKANESSKDLFIIQNPVEQHKKGTIHIDENFNLTFKNSAGTWQKLLEIKA